jgi:hypothetical protein
LKYSQIRHLALLAMAGKFKGMAVKITENNGQRFRTMNINGTQLTACLTLRREQRGSMPKSPAVAQLPPRGMPSGLSVRGGV